METFIRDVHELKKRKKATNEEIHPMEIAELFCDAYHKDNRGRQPNVWYSMLFKGIETVLKTYRNTKTQRDNLPLKIKMVTNSINRLFFHEPSTDGRLSIYSKDASTTATLDYLQTIASTVDATDVIQNVPSVQRARVSWMHIGDSSFLYKKMFRKKTMIFHQIPHGDLLPPDPHPYHLRRGANRGSTEKRG